MHRGWRCCGVVLAFLSSDTTYHLAPLLVAGVPPTFRRDAHPGLSWRSLATYSMIGLSLALATTLFLSVGGAMAGPSLLPAGGAAYESVVFSVAGAVGGFGTGLWMTRRPRR